MKGVNTKYTAVCFSLKKTAENCILEWYMHDSLFFSKNTVVCYILECYMHVSLFFPENTAVYYILDSTELVFRKFGPTKI